MDPSLLIFTLGFCFCFLSLAVQSQQNVSSGSQSVPPPSKQPLPPPPPPPPSPRPPPPSQQRRHAPPPTKSVHSPPQSTIPESKHSNHDINHQKSPSPAKKKKPNLGKRLGLLFVGVAVILQVCVVAFLLIKRRQLLKADSRF